MNSKSQAGNNNNNAGNNTGNAGNAGAGAGNNTGAAGAGAGAAAGGDPQTSLTLDPKVIAGGFANDGQDVPADGLC